MQPAHAGVSDPSPTYAAVFVAMRRVAAPIGASQLLRENSKPWLPTLMSSPPHTTRRAAQQHGPAAYSAPQPQPQQAAAAYAAVPTWQQAPPPHAGYGRGGAPAQRGLLGFWLPVLMVFCMMLFSLAASFVAFVFYIRPILRAAERAAVAAEQAAVQVGGRLRAWGGVLRTSQAVASPGAAAAACGEAGLRAYCVPHHSGAFPGQRTGAQARACARPAC